MSKEKPMLFSGPMVRAILNGTKTQTRRIAKPQPKDAEDVCRLVYEKCPHPIGSRIWVKETWQIAEWFGDHYEPAKLRDQHCQSIRKLYRADWKLDQEMSWRPSIHMPRWASRIDLEVTNVRVERLNDISEDDARKEGCNIGDHLTGEPESTEKCFNEAISAREAYQYLWESINGKGSWELNPWVFVYDFRRVKP